MRAVKEDGLILPRRQTASSKFAPTSQTGYEASARVVSLQVMARRLLRNTTKRGCRTRNAPEIFSCPSTEKRSCVTDGQRHHEAPGEFPVGVAATVGVDAGVVPGRLGKPG
jgi:hypothetical protein